MALGFYHRCAHSKIVQNIAFYRSIIILVRIAKRSIMVNDVVNEVRLGFSTFKTITEYKDRFCNTLALVPLIDTSMTEQKLRKMTSSSNLR